MANPEAASAELRLELIRLERRSSGIAHLIEEAFEEKRELGRCSLEPEELENLAAMSEELVTELGAVLEEIVPGHRRLYGRVKASLAAADRMLNPPRSSRRAVDLTALGPKPRDAIRERRRPRPRLGH